MTGRQRGQISDYCLVVDDDESFAEIVSLWLSSRGIDVVCCHSARSARKTCAERPPKVVICDVELGVGVSGPALVTELREDNSELVAVYVSGHRDEAVDYDRDSNLDAFLQKPFELARLEALLAPHFLLD